LDRRLVADADATRHPVLGARSWQLTRPAACRRLAARLEALLTESGRPQSHRSGPVPVCRPEVKAARSEILRIAARLREPRAVRPAGVVLLRRILCDGGGPLYVDCGNDELYRRLRVAHTALD
jgi:hypothetical protein